MSVLTFDQPAQEWLECLPLGNGALGAMFDGGLDALAVSLNHESGWSGTPGSELRRERTFDAEVVLQRARERVEAGDPSRAAAALAPLQAPYSQAFLPLGSLEWRRKVPAEDYERSLDLATSVHRVSARGFRERAIASVPHAVLVVETSAASSLSFKTPHEVINHKVSGKVNQWLIRFPQDVPPHFEEMYPPYVSAESPGTTIEAAVVAHELETADGSSVLILAAETTFTLPGQPLRSLPEAVLAATSRVREAADVPVDELFELGEAEHRRLFERCTVSFDSPANSLSRTTGDRLAEAFVRTDHPLAEDPGLAAILFDYGRYLAICGSRPGGLPLTLQGIWNDSTRPPWSSNYTLNINTEMNYWAAHSTNMSEVADPLRDFVDALSTAGAATAARLYGAPGWVAHHNSDIWLFSSPVGDGHGDARWSHWPMSGLWLARSLYDAVEFRGDENEAERIYPIVRGAVEFALAWHHRGPDGRWSTSPSTSPENTYLTSTGTEAAIDRFSEMDSQLLSDAFQILVSIATIIGRTDDPVVAAAVGRLQLLSEQPHISADGRVREWSEEHIEADPHHRHVSHLYGLYPGAGQWDAASRIAATKTLEARGDESTGWSLMWKMALWARLGRADKTSDLLALMFREATNDRGPEAGGLYPNLLAAHPPFQIDANLAFPAVIAECLLQSHRGIELLPALPRELRSGSARGLVARHAIEVDIDWRDGQLISATLRNQGPPREVLVRWSHMEVRTRLGSELRLTPDFFAQFSGRSSTFPTSRP